MQLGSPPDGVPTALHAAAPPPENYGRRGRAVIGMGGGGGIYCSVREGVLIVVLVVSGGVQGTVQARRSDGCASP